MPAALPVYTISFRCYYPSPAGGGPSFTQHYQTLPLRDIQRWIDSYRFTHPECRSISVKLWFTPEEALDEAIEA